MMTPSHDFGEYRGGKFLTTDVALVIAVGEPCRDFSQVITSDWLTTKRTERLRARRPVIHQDKFHLPPPSTEFFQDHGSSSPHSLRLMYFARGKMALRGLRSLARRCVDFPGLGAPRGGRPPDRPCAHKTASQIRFGIPTQFANGFAALAGKCRQEDAEPDDHLRADFGVQSDDAWTFALFWAPNSPYRARATWGKRPHPTSLSYLAARRS
jgi:hypothetical protein